MFAQYIIWHLVVGVLAPMFFAGLLPITTLVTILIAGNWRNVKEALCHPVFKGALVLSVVLFISCLSAGHPAVSFEEVAQATPLLLCTGLLWSLRTNNKSDAAPLAQKTIAAIYIISLAMFIALNLALNFGWLDAPLHIINRQLAILIIFFWPICLYVTEDKEKPYLIAASALLWPAIFTSASETAMAMLLTSSLIYLIMKVSVVKTTPQNKRTAIFSLFLICLVATPLVLAAIEDPWVKQFIVGHLGDKSIHYKIWILSQDMALENFPLGIGIGNTPLLNTPEAMAARGFPMLHPHNFLIELILELGLLGLIIGLTLIGAAIRLFHQTPLKNQPLTAATLISIFTLYSITFSIWQEWRLGAVAFVLVLLQRANMKAKIKPVSVG